MASFNRVILIGNLTRDVELRYTPSGTAVADLGLAVNEKYKDANGEWVEAPVFCDVTAWGRTAEIANEYLAKGVQVMIEGRLKLDQWEDKDGGGKRSKLKVTCEKLVMLGKPKGGGDRDQGDDGDYQEERQESRQRSNGGRQSSSAGSSNNAGSQRRTTNNPQADDIPF